MTHTTTWRDLCPAGAVRFYEGDDPDGFAAEMKEMFGLDVTQGGTFGGYRYRWTEECGYSFFLPPEHIDAVYGDYDGFRARWPLGS